jgi:FAD/FMN-containing dehydrogenase
MTEQALPETDAGKATASTKARAALVDVALVDALKTDFAGEIILPGDPTYDKARRIWNASIDKHPAMIARCSGVADIASAVGFARANGLSASVRGGGHNVAGRALCDSGVVIDLSRMKGVIVDPQVRTVRVQGGATLADVDRETHAYSLAFPTGTVSMTGIAGLTLGGGVGWLVRKYGLTCDNLISCEVVTANGDLVTASETVLGPARRRRWVRRRQFISVPATTRLNRIGRRHHVST